MIGSDKFYEDLGNLKRNLTLSISFLKLGAIYICLIASKIDSFLVGMKVGHPGSTMAVNFGIPSLKNETKDLSHNMSKGL